MLAATPANAILTASIICNDDSGTSFASPSPVNCSNTAATRHASARPVQDLSGAAPKHGYSRSPANSLLFWHHHPAFRFHRQAHLKKVNALSSASVTGATCSHVSTDVIPPRLTPWLPSATKDCLLVNLRCFPRNRSNRG